MAMTLAEIRDQYPQYADMSDEALARSLHQKFYSDMDFGEFAGKVGYQIPDPAGINQPSLYDRAARAATDFSVGGGETLATMGSAIAAEPVAGLAGIVQGVNPWASEGASARAVEGVRDFLTYDPMTPQGRRGVEMVAGAMEPIANALETAETAIGDTVYEATDSPLLAAGATTIPTAALELVGVGLGRGATRVRQATPENVKPALEQVGVPAEQITDDMAERVAGALNESGDFSPESVAEAVASSGQQDYIPRTRAEQTGMDTGNFDLWRKQNEAAAGVYGDAAEQRINQFTDMRERTIGDIVQGQMDALGPSEGATSLGSLSDQLYEGILSRVGGAKQAKTDAYRRVDDVAAENGPMMAPPDVMKEGMGAAYQGFGGKIKLASEAETPRAYSLYRELQGAMRGEQPGDLPGALSPVGNRMESLDNFESLRRRISAAERSAEPGSQDQALLGQVRRQYDEWLDKAVDEGKFFGSPEQLESLKEARRLNREYMNIVKGTHKDGKPTARTRIINDVVNGRSTPEQVVNQIIGSTGRKQGAQVVNDFKRLFGEKSPEFGALRQAAFLNIFGPAIKVAEDGSLRLGKGQYINRLSDQLRNNQSNLNALFSESEVGRWKKFAGELQKLQEDVRKKNFSGSAYHMAPALNAITDKLGMFAQWLPFIREGGESIGKARNWRDLRKHGLAAGDFKVSPDGAGLIGALVGGGAAGGASAAPALLVAEDEQPRNVGVLATQ